MSCLLALCLQLGLVHANHQGCGIWYMCGVLYPHQLNISSVYGELSLEREHWRVGASYDGRLTTQGVVGPDPDGTFSSCGGAPSITCPATHFSTVTKEQNLCAQYIWRLGAVGLAAGPCVYHATFSAVVPDWVYRSHLAWVVQPVVMSANKWQPGAALGVSYGHWLVQVKMCELRGVDNSGNNMPSACRGVLGEAAYRF